MKSEVRVEAYAFECIVGVHSWERECEQTVLLDLRLSIDASKAMQTDDLADTVDYVSAAKLVETEAKEGQYQLLEALAFKATSRLFDQFERVSSIVMTLRKPQAMPGSALVGFHLERSRDSA